MVVANIVREQPLQMEFVHCDDVVQQLMAATLDPSLRNAILPRAFERSPHWPDPQRANGRWHIYSVLAIPIEDQESRSRLERKRFPELLNDPQARRMLGDIEVENLTAIMTDHEEAVEHAEPEGWNCEEVHRRDGFSVIAKKGQTALGWLRISWCSFHPPGNRSLSNIEAQHEKLPVDARCSPSCILGHHAKDQFPHFLRNRSSPNRPSHFGN